MTCKPEGTHHNACDCREAAFNATNTALLAICKAWATYQIARMNERDDLDLLSDRIIEAERLTRKL